jgi:hypothetical protein
LLFASLLVLLLAPAAALAYLPMTDLPQHLAVASILLHGDDPQLGFAAYYAPAWERSLYVLPYLGALALAPLVSLETGMRAMVLLGLAALPLGVLALVRARGRPAWLALLALPLVYNRAFFWGFVSFELALGLALAALALLVRPPKGIARELVLAALCAAIVFTHPYGLLLLTGYALLWLLIGERRALLRRTPALAPLFLGALAWALRAGQGVHAFTYQLQPLARRLDDFEESVLGGYRDASEAWLLLAWLAVWAVLALRSAPISRARWRALAHHDRVLWAFAGSNLLLFALLPVQTSVVGELPMRHALIACSLLPVLARPPATRKRAALGAVALLALVAAGSAAVHLVRFDREARPFDAVVAQVPFGARLLALTWDANGDVMRTWPYWHFGAYVQARRGGLLAQSFPDMFWNLPVRMREDAGIPPSPPNLFAKPQLFDAAGFGGFYDHLLVRGHDAKGRDRFAVFPYELVFEAPPWQLWRKTAGS